MPGGITERGPLDRTKLLREKVHTSDKSRLKIQELEGRLRWTNDMVAFFGEHTTSPCFLRAARGLRLPLPAPLPTPLPFPVLTFGFS
jgi:hypothetical protein